MKEFLFIVLSVILFVLGVLTLANAAPFLVSDNSTAEVDSCQVTGLGAVPCTLAGKGIKIDLASLPAGSYTVTAKFCSQGGYGVVWPSLSSSPNQRLVFRGTFGCLNKELDVGMIEVAIWVLSGVAAGIGIMVILGRWATREVIGRKLW